MDAIAKICRLCLEPDQAQVPIFKEGKTDNDLYDKISVCLPVKVSKDDFLPKNICVTCYKSVDFIYDFWKLSSESETRLHNMLQENSAIIDNVEPKHNVDTLDIQEVLCDARDVGENISETNVEIREVFISDYVNQDEKYEYMEENSALINEEISENILQPECNESAALIQSSNADDIQISQIVESSNVSLRTSTEEGPLSTEEDPIKMRLWDVTLSNLFIIPYNYETEKHTIDPNTVVLMDIPKPEIQIPEETKLYMCDICDETFSEQLPFLKHNENQHKQFKCPICWKSFGRRYILENHLHVHSTRRDFACTICALTFKRKYDLVQHIKRMHSIEDAQTFECANCAYSTKHKNQIRLHVLEHLGISLYSCALCGKGFKTNLDLMVHRNNHMGIKPFQCDVCGNNFTRKHYMLQHRKTMHEELASYQCHVCGRSFSYRTSLNVHLKVHTGESRVQCDVCKKVVSGKVALANHKKMHTDEKEFVCGICGKVYVNKYSLQEHVLVHTGSKPFQCLQCDKSFSTRKKLLYHEQIHDPVRSLYYCTECGKSYVSKYKLKVHMQKNHLHHE